MSTLPLLQARVEQAKADPSVWESLFNETPEHLQADLQEMLRYPFGSVTLMPVHVHYEILEGRSIRIVAQLANNQGRSAFLLTQEQRSQTLTFPNLIAPFHTISAHIAWQEDGAVWLRVRYTIAFSNPTEKSALVCKL